MNTPNGTSAFPQSPIPHEHMGRAKSIILAVLFAIVGVIVFAMVFRHSISDAPRAQLNAIKAAEIEKAYEMTSKTFQETTSLEKFKSFIKKYPVLSEMKTVSFHDRKIDGDLGYVGGTIVGENGTTKAIEFQLIKEGSAWKIQGIQLTDVSVTSTHVENDHATVHAILVSDTADSDGFVGSENVKISNAARKIFATIQIIGSVPGGAVSATLVYLPTGKRMGPAIDKTTKAGNIMKAFSFTRENKTWQKGAYEIQVELSSGSTKSIKFKVV